MSHRIHVFPAALAMALFAGAGRPASAQWNSNPAANLAIADRGSDQNQPKIRPTSDGGCYISWFDGIGTGWDVRLQRLNALGEEQWAHGGALVADLSLSSTNEYGLAVDSSGNAILAFQDTRFGGTRITCAKVTPSMAQPWGATGVQVSIGNGNSPHCAALSDGSYVVGWTEGSNLRRQKIDTTGVPQWTVGGLFEPPPASNSDLICDVIAADGGNVMISWSRNPSRFLHAQKYDASGTPLWNSGSPVVVFDGSALQFGYFPTFLHDGAGGGVFGYYETGGPRNAYIQRITSAGAELYPHNGVACSTNTAGRIRLTPSVAFNPAAGETFLFWTESTAPVQNMWGVYGQKFNAAGARQWTDEGKAIVSLSGLQNANVKCITSGSGAIVCWSDQPGGAATLMAARLDDAGNFTWPGGILQPCSTASTKSRLDLTASACGDALLAWADGRAAPADSNDIYAQNIHGDGVYGNKTVGDVNHDNLVNIDDLLGVITGWGPCLIDDLCSGDVHPPVCGNSVINIDDLLTVIVNWD